MRKKSPLIKYLFMLLYLVIIAKLQIPPSPFHENKKNDTELYKSAAIVFANQRGGKQYREATYQVRGLLILSYCYGVHELKRSVASAHTLAAMQ